MKLNQIGAPAGANRNTKRRGRGSGSGHGKTSCRGRKGAKKRSGRMLRAGFEGGQTPLIRRIPKRGFGSSLCDSNQPVNIGSFERFRAGDIVSPKEMKMAGLIGNLIEPVKILNTGKITKALTIKAHKVSASAMKSLTAAGCKVELIK